MDSIEVVAPNDLVEWVRSRVESGEYATAGDYVLALIRRDRSGLTPLSVADIKGSIEEGRARDDAVPAEEVFDRIEHKLRAMID